VKRGSRHFFRQLALIAGGIFLFLFITPVLTAADWPQFRGNPSLTGIAADPMPDKPALLWTYKTGGPVRSSPAVAGGKVFVGSDDMSLHALDLATGKSNWVGKTEGVIESSPLVLEGRVYFGSDDGVLRCLDAATGKPVWKFEAGDKIPGSPNFTRSADGKSWSILFGSFDSGLYCLDAITGRSNWVFQTGTGIKGTPGIADGITAVGGCDAVLHIISLKDGTMLKEIEIGAPMMGSVALTTNRAYVGHYENEFKAIDLDKGTNLWTFKERAFPFVSSPALTKDFVIFGGRDKRLRCVKRETGEEVWNFPTRGKVDSSPVVVGDRVVVGSDDGRLYVVSLATGKELWSYEIGQPIESSPAMADGKIVVGCNDGSVYCFGKK